MKLKCIHLRNYRCFDVLTVKFHPQMTVIVAENGIGKTTILDAIRVALWPFVNSFDLARSSTFNDPSNGISVDDVMRQKHPLVGITRLLPTEVMAVAHFDNVLDTEPPTNWMRYRGSEAPRTKTRDDQGSKELQKWAAKYQDRIRQPNRSPIPLPVLGYYGTGRLWAHKKLTEGSKDGHREDGNDFFIRTFAYRDCMDPASSYKHFRQWYIWAWNSFVNMQVSSHTTEEERYRAQSRIKVVQQVIDTFLKDTTGWYGLEYSLEEDTLVLNHEEHGVMPAELLSDGIRSMLALVGDIAYRCIKLNPHLLERAATETEGIVLIDEVDMHLHPRWQQLVLTQMQLAFPKIQFVVTTHSPQVLTTTKPECIRALRWKSAQMPVDAEMSVNARERSDEVIPVLVNEQRIEVLDEFAFSEGAEAQQLLQDILGVAPRPEQLPIVRELNEYLSLIQEDKWDSPRAMELQAKLKAWGGEHEAALIRADMDIRMRQYRRK